MVYKSLDAVIRMVFSGFHIFGELACCIGDVGNELVDVDGSSGNRAVSINN